VEVIFQTRPVLWHMKNSREPVLDRSDLHRQNDQIRKEALILNGLSTLSTQNGPIHGPIYENNQIVAINMETFCE
jgi:hypothetical protein